MNAFMLVGIACGISLVVMGVFGFLRAMKDWNPENDDQNRPTSTFTETAGVAFSLILFSGFLFLFLGLINDISIFLK